MTQLTIKDLLVESLDKLPNSDTPRLDAEVLLSYLLGKNRSYLYAHSLDIVDLNILEKYTALINLRNNKIPIAYLTGSKEFWSNTFKVTRNTLIPRPCTEIFLQVILKLILKDNARILELGTGSGAIAISLAKLKPKFTIIATDISLEALKVAKSNAQNLQVENVDFIQSNWFEKLDFAPFDAIIANPPYLAAADLHLNNTEISHEPKLALVAGETGLEAINQIVQEAKPYLINEGYLMIEHGLDQDSKVQEIFNYNGYYNIQTFKDLNALPRLTIGTLIKPS